MKKINNKALTVRIITALLLVFSCFFMYDFYKCLSGFIANGFREPLVMLPMILAFFLPVVCFLVFFYDFYVGAIHPRVKMVYSVFVSLYAVVDLALIFRSISLYASNNSLGVYDALPSIIIHFPYDMIVILIAIFAMQMLNLFALDRRGSRLSEAFCGLKQRGSFSIGVLEYVLLCVLAIVVFVFAGSGLCATFTAFENAFYDISYLFLLVWTVTVPMANLLALALHPERMKNGRTGVALLSTVIGANLLFGLLFMIIELSYPDFIVHVGKPLFLIAFSVSLPIEPGVLIGIMALGTVILSVRLASAIRGSRGKLSCE